MLFGVKSEYGRRVDTSSSRNGASRLTIIKYSENGVLMGRRERSHYDDV
jgi:hypothetical protein